MLLIDIQCPYDDIYREVYLSDKTEHIRVIGCYYRESDICDRMTEVELSSVEHLPLDMIGAFCIAILTLIPIGPISEYRSAYRCHMDTYLMGTASFYPYREETVFLMDAGTYRLIVSDGFLTTRIYLDFCFIFRMFYPEEFRTYRITRFRWSTVDDSVVYLFYLSRLEE